VNKYKKVIGFLSQLDRDSIERIGEEFCNINYHDFLHFMRYDNIVKVFLYLKRYFPNGAIYNFKRKGEEYYSIFGKIYCETNLKKWYTETTDIFINNHFEWKTFSVLLVPMIVFIVTKIEYVEKVARIEAFFLLRNFMILF
jgi:hypothetical protein